jgi:hypothetical protein
VVERRQRQRRRPACTRGRAAVATEETVRIESGWDLESFTMKSETSRGVVLFIG